jgi:NAD(P)-dependent dehydrogenase (short-subunit alcohol dehydrogenase family)
VLGARSSLDATETAVQQAAQDAGRSKPQVLKIKLEVTNPASVADAAAEVEKSVGRLDVLINNAGVIDMTMITDSNPETWWNVWEVNVKGPYLVARAFLPLMLKVENSLKQVITVARYVSMQAGASITLLSN